MREYWKLNGKNIKWSGERPGNVSMNIEVFTQDFRFVHMQII
jgi:hypothetical protein